MNEIITVRDSDIIAAEINTIKEDTQRVMIANAIRIGQKLTEAKSMVEHGQWGKWLEEKVSYSQSTANNLMKLFQEYGSNQESLFDNWTNSETFGKLTYTQHLSLLALPFADRAEFAESHNVAEMSSREVEKAVKEQLEKAEAALAQRDKDLDAAHQREQDLEADLETLREDLASARAKAGDAAAAVKSYAKQTADAEKAKTKAEKNAADATKKVRDLETKLLNAQTAEKVAREELAKALENPAVPESTMEQIRREVEAEAAKKTAEEIQKKLDEAQRRADAAKAQAQAAEAKLAEIQKQAKMDDPDIAKFQAAAEAFQQSFNTLNGYRLKVAARNPDAGERLMKFQTALLSQLIDTLQGV